MARVSTLKNRRDFLRLRSGRKWVTPAFVLQGAPRPAEADGETVSGARFGFTVSGRAVAQDGAKGRRRGGAVRRNRARRRLREAVRLVAPKKAREDFDYVVIGRAAALDREFSDLLKDLHTAFDRVHASERRGGRKT
jgi:ribonuclease P protein component